MIGILKRAQSFLNYGFNAHMPPYVPEVCLMLAWEGVKYILVSDPVKYCTAKTNYGFDLILF